MLFKKRKQRTSLPEVVYELKPGGHYLIEYREALIDYEEASRLSGYFKAKDIDVVLVPNPTLYRMFEPVPATPKGNKR